MNEQPDKNEQMNRSGERVDAVLRVLAGEDPIAVASDIGRPPEELDDWVLTFVEAGQHSISSESERTQARDEYLAVVAHELTTPITVIKGIASIQQRLDADNAQIDVIVRNAARLERLVADIRDATAVALGRLRLHVAPVELAETLRAAVEEYPDADIAADLDPLSIMADEERLRQVFTNLLNNAVRHGGDGQIEISVDRVDDTAEIRVSSPGEIEPQVAASLFEPFEKGKRSSGTGLGLSVCRSLALAHDGTIGLETTDGRTTFWMRLPVEGPNVGLIAETNDRG